MCRIKLEPCIYRSSLFSLLTHYCVCLCLAFIFTSLTLYLYRLQQNCGLCSAARCAAYRINKASDNYVFLFIKRKYQIYAFSKHGQKQ